MQFTEFLDDPISLKNHLADKQEIMAYAWQITYECEKCWENKRGN